MADSTAKYHMEPLKGPENYFSWQIQVQDVLTDLDLLGYPIGATTRPVIISTDIATWDKNDRKALSAIRLRCASAVVPHIMGCTTSKKAWDTLKNTFAMQGTMSKVTATRRLTRYKIDEGADMEEEVKKLKKLKEQVILIGGKVTDEEFAFSLLAALPPSWDAFISAAQGLTQSSEVIGRIIQEDERRKDRDSSSTALVAKGGKCTPKKKPKKKEFKHGIFCHECGKEGHIRPDCPSHKTQQSGSSSSATQHAHIVEINDDNSYAFIAHANTQAFVAKKEVWLGDTATQSHIVRDCSAFVTYTETPGCTITGAGTCAAQGRGDVCIVFITKTGTVPVTLKDVLHAPSLEYNLLSLHPLA